MQVLQDNDQLEHLVELLYENKNICTVEDLNLLDRIEDAIIKIYEPFLKIQQIIWDFRGFLKDELHPDNCTISIKYFQKKDEFIDALSKSLYQNGQPQEDLEEPEDYTVHQ